MSATETITLRNQLSELERLNKILAEFGRINGFNAEEENTIFLCAEEICTNIISYAWPDGDDHAFEVRITADIDTIHIEFEDDGLPFAPISKSAPDLTSPVEERPIGGLGIHLVLNTMTSVRYERKGDRNLLIAEKVRDFQ